MQIKIGYPPRLSPGPVDGRWFRPPPGYSKLNVDGSFQDGKATYGGLLRDTEGNWVWGYTGFCGFTSPLHAELMSLKEGLLALLQCRHLHIIVESDSSEAVNLINGFPDEEHSLLSVVLECKSIHSLLRSSSITYVP